MSGASDGVPVSVVMPVYNEANGIAEVVADIQRHILDRVPGSELVVVDDRSTDASPTILDGLAALDPRIRVLVNEQNAGHGRSTRRAMDAARGAWIFHLDSDGQVEVSEFDLLWSRRADHDLVLGTRTHRHDPWHRLVLTRATRLLVSILGRRRIADSNVPFKLIRRVLFEHLVPVVPDTVFAPSILFVLGAHRSGASVLAVETTHLARVHGRSTLNVRRLSAAVVQCARETLAFSRRRVPPYRRT